MWYTVELNSEPCGSAKGLEAAYDRIQEIVNEWDCSPDDETNDIYVNRRNPLEVIVCDYEGYPRIFTLKEYTWEN